MNIKSCLYVSVFLLGFIPFGANALVLGGSNLDFTGYPDHDCYKPSRPYSMSNEYEVANYKSDVEQYIQCIKEYVENAKNDIERITEAANDAINEANNRY